MTVVRLAVFAWLIAVVPAPSWADAGPDHAPASRPWAIGVSESDQALALQLYREGNAEFIESRFLQALAKYQLAIRHWDHPAIRFNMAVCLIHLDHPVEAKDNLERGLAYGAAPLGNDVHLQGLTYRKLLDARLARLTITCGEPDAEVVLDGKRLFTGPGHVTTYLLSGDHQIVTTKPGFLTTSEPLRLAPGTSTALAIRLVAFEAATRTVRRWPRWKPYALSGAGGLVAAAGALMLLAAADNFAAYDEGIRTACPVGCSATKVTHLRVLRATRGRADLQQRTAVSMLAAGGAVLVTGAIALYLNQPRAQLALVRSISVSPDTGGAVLSIRGAF